MGTLRGPTSGMQLGLTGIWLAWLLLNSVAVADEPAVIAQRLRQQQQSVDAARQLIAEVLDIQLDQFAENRLTTLPVYSDVRQMRSNLQQVSQRDMRHIIELLGTAQHATGAAQAASLEQARATAREVVAVLMAERERLRQRLQTAHLQAQLKQLMDKQQETRTSTRHLHQMARDRRDAATLSTLEDQRDTHTLFEQLLESLQTALEWEDPEGRAVADGLRQLQENRVERLFTEVEAKLSQGEIDGASLQQTEILSHLSSVLKTMQAASGLGQADRAAAVNLMRDLITTQQQLLDDTTTVDTGDPRQPDTLSQRQHDICQQLGALAAPVGRIPTGEELLHQTQTAADQAEGKLFEGAWEEAIDRQRDVLRYLDALQELLAASPSDALSAQVPDPVTDQIEQLAQLQGALAELSEQQEQIVEDATTRPATAQPAQQQMAAQLADQADRDPLPPSVQHSVRRAADQASKASQTLQDHSPWAGSARRGAAQAVQEALQAARTETSAQLQAARTGQQQTGADSLAQSTRKAEAPRDEPPGPTQTPQASPNNSNSRSATSRGTSTQPTDSESTDPNAVASSRTVGDGQRAADDRTLAEGQATGDAPWFARLPPGVQDAVRSRGRRQPPPGYEERLRRYFESADR